MVGVPLLWGILLLFIPPGDEYYAAVKDKVGTWQMVHIGTMLFIPLMAGVLFLLLRGLDGIAAWVSRIALAVFAVFYLAWEVLVGIGTGLIRRRREPTSRVGTRHGSRSRHGVRRQPDQRHLQRDRHRRMGHRGGGSGGRSLQSSTRTVVRRSRGLAGAVGTPDCDPRDALRSRRAGLVHHRSRARGARPRASRLAPQPTAA